MLNSGMFTSNTSEWATPQDFFDKLNAEFHFTLDPCATPENAKCGKFYTKEQNGLAQDWTGETVFCNPPYGKEISAWVEKCYKHSLSGECAVMLIPSRTDTRWFHEWVYGKAELRFVKGRLRFNDSKSSAPFPSLVVVYRGATHDEKLPPAQPEPLSDAYTKAVWTWLLDYQIKAAKLKGRYTPYEMLSWVANDWRKEHERSD